MSEMSKLIVKAAEEAMGSQVSIDLDEHRDVAAAVLRALAEHGDDVEFALNPTGYIRELADEINPASEENPNA